MFGIIAGILSGVGAIASLAGGREAEKAADRQAAEEARLEGIVTDEKIRQLGVEEEVVRGETIASVAGSGVKVDSGSPLMVLATQASEYERLRNVTREAGASRAANALARGDLVGKQAKYGSYSSAANQFANMFSLIGPHIR